jgi:cadmium resistance protein CadD (predicted permease)
VAAAFGATFLPEDAIPYLGLLPLALGLKAAWQTWKHRNNTEKERKADEGGPRILEVAAVTFANGGDNIGVHVPVFATAGLGGMSVYVVVFLVLLAVWIAALGFLAPLRFAALASVPRILALAAGFSVLVEAAQYVLRLDRVSSVDDVLLNTAGAGLAALASCCWWRATARASSDRPRSAPVPGR